MNTRRKFLTTAGAGVLAAPGAQAAEAGRGVCASVSLDGEWRFRVDEKAAWKTVTVPHTWQVTPGLEEHYGTAWYERTFDVPAEWSASVARVEFEAVFHSAWVAVNGQAMGEHPGKGYTAFVLDITRALKFGGRNTIAVKVDNGFNENMLPRGRSSDWAHDGGIYRPVSLLVTPKTYIERVDVDAIPEGRGARLEIDVVTRNVSGGASPGPAAFRVIDEQTGALVLSGALKPGARHVARMAEAKAWHFDHPNLYRLAVEWGGHSFETTFGVRSFEARDGAFYLNGERVRLMGVERMAGSNPEFGMAEPAQWLIHDHDDMKELNCVFTRVHWQQDRRVLDYCDRKGMLIQVEVPTWGPKTFGDTKDQPAEAIMRNGLEQLREMIQRDRNHPSVMSWGLCNEIGGQNPPAYNFAKRMYEEAKKLDPRRLRSYASNSLTRMPEKDVSALMDFVEWNEYYESWYKGTPEDMRRNLEEIHRAFPDKTIVISEYGYCACTAERPEGDAARVRILRGHDRVFREHSHVGGLIFFCYNDYRTHIGDRGKGVMKQRVHGVVNVYGERKPSYEELRAESSPVEEFTVTGDPGRVTVRIRTRASVPNHTLRGYKLRAIVYGNGNIPLERVEVALPDLAPGARHQSGIKFDEKAAVSVRCDIIRPTGFSMLSAVWKP